MKFFFEIAFFVIVVLFLVYIFFVFAKNVLSPASQEIQTGSVCIKNVCFSVEVAKTSAEIGRGLMGRAQLDKDKGMLFIFEKEGIYPFWMKNTLIPLDIIWVDASGKIIYIAEDTQPCKNLICPQILPSARAKYVLELNAGIVSKTGIKVGDLVKIPPGL